MRNQHLQLLRFLLTLIRDDVRGGSCTSQPKLQNMIDTKFQKNCVIFDRVIGLRNLCQISFLCFLKLFCRFTNTNNYSVFNFAVQLEIVINLAVNFCLFVIKTLYHLLNFKIIFSTKSYKDYQKIIYKSKVVILTLGAIQIQGQLLYHTFAYSFYSLFCFINFFCFVITPLEMSVT